MQVACFVLLLWPFRVFSWACKITGTLQASLVHSSTDKLLACLVVFLQTEHLVFVAGSLKEYTRLYVFWGRCAWLVPTVEAKSLHTPKLKRHASQTCIFQVSLQMFYGFYDAPLQYFHRPRVTGNLMLPPPCFTFFHRAAFRVICVNLLIEFAVRLPSYMRIFKE